MEEWIVVGCLVVVMVLLVLVIRLIVYAKKLNGSIAKLGYIIREDAKKYFDDASNEVINVGKKSQDMNREAIREGTKLALTDAQLALNEILADTQRNSGRIILDAREEATRIVESAKAEADAYRQKALDQSVVSIQWTLEEYVSKAFSTEHHEALIKTLVDQQGRNEEDAQK